MGHANKFGGRGTRNLIKNSDDVSLKARLYFEYKGVMSYTDKINVKPYYERISGFTGVVNSPENYKARRRIVMALKAALRGKTITPIPVKSVSTPFKKDIETQTEPSKMRQDFNEMKNKLELVEKECKENKETAKKYYDELTISEDKFFDQLQKYNDLKNKYNGLEQKYNELAHYKDNYYQQCSKITAFNDEIANYLKQIKKKNKHIGILQGQLKRKTAQYQKYKKAYENFKKSTIDYIDQIEEEDDDDEVIEVDDEEDDNEAKRQRSS